MKKHIITRYIVPTLFVAFFMCVYVLVANSLEIKASEKKTIRTLDTVKGPSQAFLNDFGKDITYILESDDRSTLYQIYASGTLDDGTVVYAAKGFDCIAILPTKELIEGYWGGEGFVPYKIHKNYVFKTLKSSDRIDVFFLK